MAAMNLTADRIPQGFDTDFALNQALLLAEAAYAVMQAPDTAPKLPDGWERTALIKVRKDLLTEIVGFVDRIKMLRLLHDEPDVFGLMGRNAAEKIAFVSFRGTQTASDWAQNLDTHKTSYEPVAAGDVHHGFHAIYMSLRESIRLNLAAACEGCDRLFITGHSLGGALAVLSVLDLDQMVPGKKISVLTFAGACAGCVNFSRTFNAKFPVCYRVVGTADAVPHVPAPVPPDFPYEHVGVEIHVDQGTITDAVQAHSLENSYGPGLENLIKSLTRSAGLP
jgi:triacylglycerol lipase